MKLVKFEAESKIKLIKEVKAQSEGMNLVQVSSGLLGKVRYPVSQHVWYQPWFQALCLWVGEE